MKKINLTVILLTTILLCACTGNNKNNTNNIEEGIVFNSEDSAEITDAKWGEYVNTSIALQGDECKIHTFIANNNYYGVYNCHQPSTDPEFTDLDRAGILELVADNRILTCNEANGEQGAGYDEEQFGKFENKTCAEIEDIIENKITQEVLK